MFIYIASFGPSNDEQAYLFYKPPEEVLSNNIETIAWSQYLGPTHIYRIAPRFCR
jgi:hypothetical protein